MCPVRVGRSPHANGKVHTMATGNDFTQGIIDPNALYTVQSFMRILGIREATLRSARRAGLRVCYVHRHAYIYGRDWIDYVLTSHERRNVESVSEVV